MCALCPVSTSRIFFQDTAKSMHFFFVVLTENTKKAQVYNTEGGHDPTKQSKKSGNN